jgi:hypothetical protein
MAALTLPAPWVRPVGRGQSVRPELGVVDRGGLVRPVRARLAQGDQGDEGGGGRSARPGNELAPGRTRRSPRVSPAVRRRRALLAVVGLLLLGLALPLGGTGGHSLSAGSTPAGQVRATVYTVQPGDSLWSIVERADPNVDPRPVVAKLAAQTGSYTVQPGERITVP